MGSCSWISCCFRYSLFFQLNVLDVNLHLSPLFNSFLYANLGHDNGFQEWFGTLHMCLCSYVDIHLIIQSNIYPLIFPTHNNY